MNKFLITLIIILSGALIIGAAAYMIWMRGAAAPGGNTGGLSAGGNVSGGTGGSNGTSGGTGGQQGGTTSSGGSTQTGGSTGASGGTSGSTGSTGTGTTGTGHTTGGTVTGGTVTQGPTITVPTSDGGSMPVSDFKKDSDVNEDPNNQGYFYIGGDSKTASSAGRPYVIEYISQTQFFNVILIQEPIASAREQAQDYLANHLKISPTDLCKLNYTVSVPYSVNQYYTSMDLRFRTCPDAVVF